MMTDKNDNWYGWNYVTKIGLQEKGMLPEYQVYRHKIAVEDVIL